MIRPKAGNDNASHQVTAIAPADSRTLNKSPSISESDFPTMDDRATIIASKLVNSLCLFNRHASRNNRRARLRVTALPSLRLTEKPARLTGTRARLEAAGDSLPVTCSCDWRTYNTMQRPVKRHPSNRNLRKSLPNRSRSTFLNLWSGFPRAISVFSKSLTENTRGFPRARPALKRE